MKILDSFIATIYVGSREGYSNKIHTYDEAERILQNYCDNNPLCVTLKQIEYIYKDGNEMGFEIGLINYPRFPDTKENITQKALEIGMIFLEKFNQYKISVVSTDKTYMIEKD